VFEREVLSLRQIPNLCTGQSCDSVNGNAVVGKKFSVKDTQLGPLALHEEELAQGGLVQFGKDFVDVSGVTSERPAGTQRFLYWRPRSILHQVLLPLRNV